MSAQHRATPEQWEQVEICSGMKDQVPWATASCLRELRDRVLTMDACIRDIYQQLDRLKTLHESNWSRIVKLEEGPAVRLTTPPPETVKQWVAEVWHEGTPVRLSLSDMHIAGQAAHWAAQQLKEGPAVDESRGSGSVENTLATNAELGHLYCNSESLTAGLRAVYDLGRSHGGRHD
jgi:hypothetical protein